MKEIEIDGKSYLIDIEKATKQGLLIEKTNKRPMSWKEYETCYCLPTYSASDYNGNDRASYSWFYAADEAKAFCALGKLIQLRDAWWGDWRPNWDNTNERKYVVSVVGDKVMGIFYSESKVYTLAFPTEQMRDEFLDTFKDLIGQAKMFL